MSASASASVSEDYELDAEWAVEESTSNMTDPSGSYSPASPAVIGEPSTSTELPPVIVGHSYNLVDIGVDETAHTPVSAVGIHTTATETSLPQTVDAQEGSELSSAQDLQHEGAGPPRQLALPNLLQQEEDEDYNDAEHPIGFRRANEADMAERDGNPPDGSFSLPSRRHYEFDIRFFGAGNHNILHIARKTGTHISMPKNMDEPVMMMWGTPECLVLARHDLHALLEQVQQDIELGTRRTGGWARIKAMPSDRKQEIIDKMIYDAKIRKMYRQPPPEGFYFPVVGIFIWPPKELNPQTVLGMALEALDDIRFEHKVFILFVRKRNMLRVLGDEPKNVEIAVERIYGTFCEVAAKNRRPTRMCLVHPPSLHLSGTKVVVNENHDLVNRQVTVKRVEENKGIQVFLAGPRPNHKFLELWKTKREILEKANSVYLQKALQQGLQDIAYYRGHTKLRVYIGKMVLFGYRRAKDGVYDFLDFSEMARNPQIAGEVIRSIGSSKYGIKDEETADEVIEYCNSRPDIFHPVDSNPDIAKLGFVGSLSLEPQVSATFDLSLYDEKGRCQDVRLEVTFQRVPRSKVYRPVHKRWLTGVEAYNRRKGPLDIKIIDLESDLAYQIELPAWALYRETEHYPIFQEFIRRLSIEEIPDEFCTTGPPAPGQPDTRPRVQRISFVNLPGLSVAGVVQKTKWRYWMTSSSYVFELTRYENLPTYEVSTLYPDGVPVSYKGLETPFDTRWGCAVWNESWDQKLSQQAVTEIGYRGKWEPDIDSFFASSGAPSLDSHGGWGDDGFAEFLGRAREGLEIVKSAQENAALKKQASADGWSASMAASNSGATNTREEWAGSEEFDQ